MSIYYTCKIRNIGHFTLIKNLSQFVSSQLNKHNEKKYICDWYVCHIIMNTFVSFSTAKSNKNFFLYSCRCLHHFDSIDKLDAHDVNYRAMNDCAIWLPSEEDKWLNFKNHSNKELPFIVYAGMCTTKDGTGCRPHHTHVIHTNIIIIRYLTSNTTCGVRTATRYPSINFIAIPITSHVCQATRKIGASRKDSFIH